jgi:hypothetical protein
MSASIFTSGTSGVSVTPDGHVHVAPDWRRYVAEQGDGYDYKEVNVSDSATRLPDKHYRTEVVGNQIVVIWPSGGIDILPDAAWSGGFKKDLDDKGFVEQESQEAVTKKETAEPPVPAEPKEAAEEAAAKKPAIPEPRKPRGRPGLKATREEMESARQRSDALETWLGVKKSVKAE